MKRIIAAAFAALMATSAAAQEPYVLTDKDAGGGSVKKHYEHVLELNRTSTPVRIEARTVYSSDTFYLVADNVCMANKKVTFAFHGPQKTAGAVASALLIGVPLPLSFMPEDEADYYRREMRDFYNSRWPGLGDWFYARAAHKAGMKFAYVKGKELRRVFGVPFCEDAQ